jgi:S-adenosylmethionine decarboxylase proenzyme
MYYVLLLKMCVLKPFKEDYELAITIPIKNNETLERVAPKRYLGRHILAEFFECDPNILNSPEMVERFMTEAAIECGATIVQKCFHLFAPFGVSGVVIISESHLAIHTWPELGYAAIDFFTCGESCDPKVAYDYLKKNSVPKTVLQPINRGILDEKNLHVEHTPFCINS